MESEKRGMWGERGRGGERSNANAGDHNERPICALRENRNSVGVSGSTFAGYKATGVCTKLGGLLVAIWRPLQDDQLTISPITWARLTSDRTDSGSSWLMLLSTFASSFSDLSHRRIRATMKVWFGISSTSMRSFHLIISTMYLR